MIGNHFYMAFRTGQQVEIGRIVSKGLDLSFNPISLFSGLLKYPAGEDWAEQKVKKDECCHRATGGEKIENFIQMWISKRTGDWLDKAHGGAVPRIGFVLG